MSQTVDEIAELINKMRDENGRSSENLEKVLGGINAKLELLSDDDNLDSIRIYISELKKLVEDKSVAESIKFEEIHKDCSNLLSYQDELAKGEEVKALFNSFNDAFEKFLIETASRKECLDSIENKINEINLKAFDKKEIIDSVSNNLKQLKKDIIDSENSKTFIISNGFNNINNILTNLPQMLDSLQKNIIQISGDNSENVARTIQELNSQIENVKLAIADSTNFERIDDSLDKLVNKIDNINNESFENDIQEVKDLIMQMNFELNLSKNENEQNLKNINEEYSNKISAVNQNISDIRQYIEETIISIKEYIKEAEQISNDNREIKYVDLSKRLMNIESSLIKSSEDYENRSEDLKSKFSEFVQIIENSKSSTEEKILASLDEINNIKNEFSVLNESLRTISISNDEKSKESISVIDAGIENIILTLNNLADDVKKGSEATVKELIENSENKFLGIKNLLEELKSDDSSSIVLEKISETADNLNSELKLVSTDIIDALRYKSEDIVRAFVNIKEVVESFTEFDIENVIKNLKSQLEDSFLSFSVDINKELISHSESFSKFEQAYKDSFEKISVIEEFVTEKFQNNIEFINITIEKSINDLKNSIGEDFNNQIQNLHEYFSSVLNQSEVIESIDTIKDELSEKFNSMTVGQNLLSAKQDEIQDEINKLLDNIKSFINVASQKLVDDINTDKIIDEIHQIQEKNELLASSIDALNAKMDVFATDSAAEELQQRFDDIENANNEFSEKLSSVNAKLDVLAADSTNEELQQRFDDIENANNEFSEKLSSVNAKLDVLAADSTNEELQQRFDDIENANNIFSEKLSSLNTKLNIIATDTAKDDIMSKLDESSQKTEKFISNIVENLNVKVDAIAANDSLENLLYEIDDVKNIISEQHKIFEASSDERLTAIDKYLKDVLFKLDNVDLEKNTSDIKDSIMNALISVVDQISFVEESEDIKDFVEERTDEISKSILEVQNQLKQLTSSDDAFDYTYTLQDVESDIAKLRLAINNIQSADYTDLSDEIKRIVDAVNSLENSLTQDEMINLKANMESLNDDILSISVRTNKILLNSDESFKNLNEDLSNFRDIIYKLEDRINNLDNTEITSRIEKKLDRVQIMAVASVNADKVFHQALMYLGEWVDITTENILSVSEKVSRISDIENNINDIKTSMPDKFEVLEELRELLPDNQDLINRLVSKFQLQEERIDILENKLEKVLSILEEKNDTVLNRKVDKIEKMLSKLGTNIEKLTSYVDE